MHALAIQFECRFEVYAVVNYSRSSRSILISYALKQPPNIAPATVKLKLCEELKFSLGCLLEFTTVPHKSPTASAYPAPGNLNTFLFAIRFAVDLRRQHMSSTCRPFALLSVCFSLSFRLHLFMQICWGIVSAARPAGMPGMRPKCRQIELQPDPSVSRLID